MKLPLLIRVTMALVIITAIVGIVGSISYGIYRAGYNAADGKWQKKDAKREAAQAKANEQAKAAALAKERQYQTTLQESQNAAIEREKKLRADADAARAVNDGLRNDLAEFRRQLPSLTREAVERYADAASVVFGECTAAYQRLAETADRLDSDRQKLEEAWPK